jgi:hypothetical protein
MKSVLELCREKGILLDKELFEVINRIEDSSIVSDMIERIASFSKEKFLTKAFLTKNIEKIQEFS